MPRSTGLHKNMAAFLDLIACAEIGPAMLSKSDDGYNVIVGSKPTNLFKFRDYSRHPNVLSVATNSTAAGRYQILHRYAEAYTKQLGLPDFGPVSQDKIALQLIRECKAVALIESGQVEKAIAACASRWASLPGAGYKQPERKLNDLVAAFVAAGGVMAKA